MFRLITIFIVLSGFANFISGQNLFETYKPAPDSGNAIYFRFENATFFKNNEFESPLVKGYTLTGTWLRPKFVYTPVKNIQLELGWHYLRYNGADNSSWSKPWFSANIRFLKNWQLIFGNLNNSNNHKLISPIWEPERFLTDKPEGGFQVLHQSNKLYVETWLNWEQFIVEGDPFQEYLTAGISSEINLYNSTVWQLSIPVQVLFHHQGGEVDTSPLRVQTLANTATGLKTELYMNGFAKQIDISVYYTTFSDQKGNAGLPFENGNGIFANGSVLTKFGSLGVSYWNSEKFFGIKGMNLLQVVPGINTMNYTGNFKKQMFGLFYDLNKEFSEGIVFGARFEAWFEKNPSNFSNTAAIYLVINKDFLLKRF